MRVVLWGGDLFPTQFQAAFVENERVGSRYPPDGNRHPLRCLPVMRFRQPESSLSLFAAEFPDAHTHCPQRGEIGRRAQCHQP